MNTHIVANTHLAQIWINIDYKISYLPVVCKQMEKAQQRTNLNIFAVDQFYAW